MHGLTQSVTMDRRGRLLRLGALIAAALMLSLSSSSTSARAAESDPTIVLVHGAFASSAGSDGVAAALHKDGYKTATPALGLTSVSDDAAIVRYRFEATQALRQVLARAVVWGMLETNPAKQGVENPQRRRTEKRPFDSWEELEAVAERPAGTGRGSCSPPRPACAPASGSRSSNVTST